MNSAEREALRGLLQPTIDHVAQQPAARKLCLALALAEGFTFQLAICNSPRAAAALQLWLEDAVGSERGEGIVLTRISPYPLDPSAAGPRSLDATELSQLVLESLLEPTEVGARLVFLDASWAKPRDADAWRSLLLRLNERRNTITRKLAAPLTMIIPPLLEVDVARLASDLWSIRSVVVQIADRDVAVATATLLQNYEASYSRAEDIAALEEEVQRARVQAKRGDELAARALRVLLLRLAGAKQRVGELDEAEQLINEASSVADEEGMVACALAHSDLLIVRGEWDEALRLVDSTMPALHRLGDEWTLANAWSRRADILQARGELDEALRIRREEELPVYERLGDARELLVGRSKLALGLALRGHSEDHPEIVRLLTLALRDARRLRIPESRHIEDLIRSLGADPDAPPFV